MNADKKTKKGNTMQTYLFYYLAIVNVAVLILVGIDKWKAKHHAWRVAEKTFFTAALLGGGPGVWAGMYLFRHKTKHWYFVWGIPLITVGEYGLLFWLSWNRA